ncbi:MAG: hypothetical protein SFV53_05330 [Rickettsiales bacterium]|nr:hypothetical protein [Rickettsiales bacterium]
MKSNYQPRIRVFAGPNGSGKSMLKSILRPDLLGIYINPDEIEKNLKKFGFIDSRYSRCLELLSEAIKNSWRAYIFDNSGSKEFLLAEAKEGKVIEIKADSVPFWFKTFVLDKITK